MKNNFLILENTVLKTLAYFDIFDYPLSLFEIWKWLFWNQESGIRNQEEFNILAIKNVLQKSERLKSLIKTQDGFYFFSGRENLVKKRLYLYNIANKKFKKAINIIKFLRWMPFVRCIGVCNSLALSNASKDSDIDLFVITSNKRIWIARFYIIGFLKIFGLRPKRGRQKDKFCISFFASSGNLSFKELVLANNNKCPDIHFMYWLMQFVSIYNEKVFNKMYKENSWIYKYLPNAYEYETSHRRRVNKTSYLKTIIEIMHFDFLETIYKWMQLKILPRCLKELAKKNDTRVVISNKLLKFHSNDRRDEYRKRFIERCRDIL